MPGSCCYPKAARLRRRAEYLALQRRGRRRQTPNFLLASAVNPHGTAARIGITVSAKVGNAVVRNRVKRAVREIFRAVRPSLEPTLEVVVIARPSAAGLRHPAIANELRGALLGG